MSAAIKRKVLLVEDDYDHIELVRRAFEFASALYDLSIAHSLAEARQMIEASLPDLVIADLILPDGQGYELLPASHEDKPVPFPLVVMTSHGDEAIAVDAIKAGAVDYHVKSHQTMTNMPHLINRALREWASNQKRLETEKALRLSEERYALAQRVAQLGSWERDLETNILFWSDQVAPMFGMKQEDFDGSFIRYIERLHPDDRKKVTRVTENSIEHQTSYQIEYRVIWPDKSEHWINESGSFVVTEGKQRLLGIVQDITKRKTMEEQLRHKALHDVLTNIPNRAVLLNHLNFCIDYAKRNNDYQYALLFIDLNKFKPINDQHGHVMGDKVLIEVAARLSHCLRPNDTAARLGGDEFALLLTGTKNPDSAIVVAKRVTEALTEPIKIDDESFQISAAIGIVSGNESLKDVETILDQADAAMYSAKHHGKDYHIYTPS